jgi:hypothetical protein
MSLYWVSSWYMWSVIANYSAESESECDQERLHDTHHGNMVPCYCISLDKRLSDKWHKVQTSQQSNLISVQTVCSESSSVCPNKDRNTACGYVWLAHAEVTLFCNELQCITYYLDEISHIIFFIYIYISRIVSSFQISALKLCAAFLIFPCLTLIHAYMRMLQISAHEYTYTQL